MQSLKTIPFISDSIAALIQLVDGPRFCILSRRQLVKRMRKSMRPLLPSRTIPDSPHRVCVGGYSEEGEKTDDERLKIVTLTFAALSPFPQYLFTLHSVWMCFILFIIPRPL
ncbi:hypothetical protein NPIL_76761 [Nephila pilipes]|uniref:Uncharacterized protein n=1 Tax=Nephila pilipes TaxID=299642 RepID=A0A8X6JQ04_NEPPI|nr:hypothetical protein NPIL_76761 [Nephila pilipes]